jgi:DNA modification methylase
MELVHDECLNHLRSMEDNSCDSLITDPPAGIGFMNKEWDKNKGGRDHWIDWFAEVMKESLRVLKPGAHGLVWALPRTSHWTATALENAGFEVRDVVNHIFGSGFPKSLDVSKAIDKAAGAKREVIEMDITCSATPEAKQWDGFGTALKPAHEHWILIRKPLSEKSVAKNVLEHGTGALNIDASRIKIDFTCGGRESSANTIQKTSGIDFMGNSTQTHETPLYNKSGRFPANLILSEESAKELDDHSGILKSGDGQKSKNRNSPCHNGGFKPDDSEFKGSKGGASRFFYVAKASRKDRGEGNTHPTVKSTKLMEDLIKLITPPGGVILDPFMGSGSTGVAAKRLGFGFVGIEQDREYFDIALRRIG